MEKKVRGASKIAPKTFVRNKVKYYRISGVFAQTDTPAYEALAELPSWHKKIVRHDTLKKGKITMDYYSAYSSVKPEEK